MKLKFCFADGRWQPTLTSRALHDVLQPVVFQWWKQMETLSAGCYGHTFTSVQKDAAQRCDMQNKNDGPMKLLLQLEDLETHRRSTWTSFYSNPTPEVKNVFVW